MKQIHAHQRKKRNVRAETRCIAHRHVYTYMWHDSQKILDEQNARLYHYV